ncbi:hypothetical protein E2C01_023582 [Portunus trituberculatus]|uniref:Uncharacterized protein n=1 Tax=Portunus trituberculatus TaxID=210409 RepID=A0A5B7E8D4_PORTR|nr:hypothetical protein [Portunus trituberculatus]
MWSGSWWRLWRDVVSKERDYLSLWRVLVVNRGSNDLTPEKKARYYAEQITQDTTPEQQHCSQMVEIRSLGTVMSHYVSHNKTISAC